MAYVFSTHVCQNVTHVLVWHIMFTSILVKKKHCVCRFNTISVSNSTSVPLKLAHKKCAKLIFVTRKTAHLFLLYIVRLSQVTLRFVLVTFKICITMFIIIFIGI